MNRIRLHWDEVRKIADELESTIHLAGTESRERWRALQLRLVELERMLALSGEHVRNVAARKLATIDATLRRLRDDIAHAHD
jgi:hypothetical protein